MNYRNVKVKAVLFDYDDTLMDVNDAREYARESVAVRISEMYGIDKAIIMSTLKDTEAHMESLGIFNRKTWFRRIGDLLKIDLRNEIINELVRIYWDSWSLKSRAYPDALPVLTSLRMCGYRLGIVTNTDGEAGLKLARIRRDGMAKFFDVIIVAGDDTDRVKPSPEPFLKALSVLHVLGNEAMYVGDRPSTDIPGARAAGMYTVLIDRGNLMRLDLIEPKPDFLIKTLYDILSILKCHVGNAY